MKYEYLLFNVLVLCLSTAGVLLYPGGKFPDVKRFLFTLLFTSIPYVVWDYLVIGEWWFFNKQYLLGIYIGKIPIEELLFFFSIPWSCIVIWENMKKRFRNNYNILQAEYVLFIIGLSCSIIAFVYSWPYTLAVSLLLLVIAILSYANQRWLSRNISLLFLAIVTLFTLTFNGYLTARPIVIYNTAVKSNILIGTIPVEDIVYGLVLISAIVIIYDKKYATDVKR